MANSASILDALHHAQAKFPNNLDMQAKYLQVCVNLLKRDYGENIKTMQVSYKHYSGLLTMFPSEGKIWCVWELYSGAMQEGVGLESVDPNSNTDILHFSSNPYINEPIINEMRNV